MLVAQTIPRTVFAKIPNYLLDASKLHLASLNNVNIRLFGKNLVGPRSITNTLKNLNI